MNKEKPASKDLPDSINVVNHVSSRIKELKRIYNDVATKKSEMLIHQMLPNFMRRRAMSHNPKRLPAKYREIHTYQMKKSGLEDQIRKRPSRKYRRKPSNLLKEYSRRNKNHIWLETHIWHAKRFRMRKMWGYKVPYTPTDKRYKASYRAAVKHCLLQDISYYPCIEISGSLQTLRDGFKKVINNSQMPTITAKCFINGTREGKCTIFKVIAGTCLKCLNLYYFAHSRWTHFPTKLSAKFHLYGDPIRATTSELSGYFRIPLLPRNCSMNSLNFLE